MGGSNNKLFTWISKKLTMGEDSITKVFNKIKVNGVKDNINQGGSNQNDKNKLIIKTSNGQVDGGDFESSGDIVYSSDSNSDSSYKLSGPNKKGRWIQFKVDNMEKSVDSFGILFRRKSTK
jgi:hypothetical protein